MKYSGPKNWKIGVKNVNNITQNEVKQAFGVQTFSRGLGYFRNGCVEIGMKKGNKLLGRVFGSAPAPYEVNIDLTEGINSKCTCPIGEMCKHGVALLLQWLDNQNSILDADALLASLRKKDKEELLAVISSIIEKDPLIASKLAFSEEIKDKKFNFEAISKRIHHLLDGSLDYSELPGVIDELKEVKQIGNELVETKSFKDAIKLYLLLIEQGVTASENGVDDSDGILGEFMIECVRDCKTILQNLGKAEKDDLLQEILEIITIEDYGFETHELLYGVVTRTNMRLIEDNLRGMIPPIGEGFHGQYLKDKLLTLLSGLYTHLELHADALRVLTEVGLTSKEDYCRLAKKLMEQGKEIEAFESIQKGLQLQGEEHYLLNKLFFTLLQRLLNEGKLKTQDVNVEELLDRASNLLLRYFHLEEYELVKKVFSQMGKFQELLATIKMKCDGNVVAAILLHDGYFNEAIDHAQRVDTLSPAHYINIANIAKQNRREEDAKLLILKALKHDLSFVDASVTELVGFFIAIATESELEEAFRSITHTLIVKTFIECLLPRNPEYATHLIIRFITQLSKQELKKSIVQLNNKQAITICHAWISEFVNRSHVYYDDAIEILQIMRNQINKPEWTHYFSTFMREHSGKKKLVGKIYTSALFPEEGTKK